MAIAGERMIRNRIQYGGFNFQWKGIFLAIAEKHLYIEDLTFLSLFCIISAIAEKVTFSEFQVKYYERN